MGNKNAITYGEFFPLLKDNKAWVGATSLNGGRWMVMPKGMEIERSDKTKINNRGETIMNVAGVCWFTNLDIKKRHEDLILYKHYNPKDYPTYDNYDAINVDKVSDIPCDYDGIMGVPITFFDKYNPKQFEVLGFWNNGVAGDFLGAKKIEIETSGKKIFWNGPSVNGKATYFRVLLKRR